MSGSTAIAITAIIVSGVVGPTVAALWRSHQESRQRDFDRTKADLTELRTVIDEATTAIAAMSIAFNRVLAARVMSKGDEQELMRELFERQLEVIAAGQRLYVRLGLSHPVTQAFDELANALGIERATQLSPLPKPATKEDLEKAVKQSLASGIVYGEKVAKFAKEARSLIGSRL